MLGRSSKFLGGVLDRIVAIVIILIILFSSYSLYTTYLLYSGSFVSAKMLSLKPTPEEIQAGKINFDELKQINKDAKAWITVDDTNIDYPVVQGKTNLEYINKDIYGNFALEGAIFLDSRNSADFSDEYSLLYGHHMDNGAMFGDLEKFIEKGYFDKHENGTLLIDDGKYSFKIFAVVQADGYDEKIFNPTHIQSKKDKSEFLKYIYDIKIHGRDVSHDEDSKIIGLSTCTSVQTNGRTIIYGFLEKN